MFSLWGGLRRLRGGVRRVWHLLKVGNVNCGKVEKGGVAIGVGGNDSRRGRADVKLR